MCESELASCVDSLSPCIEADAAEQWLEVHEADLHLNETGDSIQSTVALIQRHEALEHNLLLQAERFERLKRPTQMELLDTTPADYSVLGKAASGAVVSEETLGMILAVPIVDSMLRRFGLEAEIDSTAKDHADHHEAIVNKSFDEELDSIDQAVYTGRPFNGCLSHCLLHKY
ncbi:Spectrin beta chain brain 1 [Fasciola hepatica]|uniref:Spectrin beta chain brain 1 n=1 Tax=Fasciola hepatica TaxID=6192 RepID=A0A4E0R2G2_FASHE|nr:Spectrin beta chain brain 1 [Fasciola hepatica]